ncbi:MAG: cell division/cell wall cluster transcriptional repressor MraZ [Omnitrophica bacterium RIFCSPLOWO2_01_FULL_45_24]|nr:MAG: cell division/cell wall cluster transcriptional repressor MraZ [Omnitrophica bacterium RIFCSPHIGHO2_02_FULL_46_20]OGW94433.1 MAG: cell division/cell wall cluster transcriptional repressor MraZ [Omnitrophica bacterium RIFCSPLOWO2_01_FULL_45_24]
MFYGEHEHTIDKKGRIIIPSKFRDFLKEYDIKRCYITRGLDRCLFLFTEDEWKAQESKFKSISFTKSEARKFNRLYFSGAVQVECDAQGRILLPKYLKDFAEIKRDIMIIGVSNRIEIWGKEKWHEYYESSKGSFEEIAEKLMAQEG